jgi:hypothetical protein
MATLHPSSQGCASRSDAGLAHVECRVEVAEHRMASSDGWWECGTCKQAFTGDATGAGRRVVVGRDVHGLPEENEQRLDAAENLANALYDQGKYVQAETIFFKMLAVRQRLQCRDSRAPEHIDDGQ